MHDVAAGAGLVGEHQAGGLRLEPADELVDVGLPGADLSDVGHLGGPGVEHGGDGNGVLVNIQTDEEGGRLVQG